VATQTFTFLSAAIDGSTAMVQRLADAYPDGRSDKHWLVRAGLAAPGGEEALSLGDGGFAVFGAPRACADAPIQMRRALVAQAWPRTRRC
jgi:class 3 adenylate cyclase